MNSELPVKKTAPLTNRWANSFAKECCKSFKGSAQGNEANITGRHPFRDLACGVQRDAFANPSSSAALSCDAPNSRTGPPRSVPAGSPDWKSRWNWRTNVCIFSVDRNNAADVVFNDSSAITGFAKCTRQRRFSEVFKTWNPRWHTYSTIPPLTGSIMSALPHHPRCGGCGAWLQPVSG